MDDPRDMPEEVARREQARMAEIDPRIPRPQRREINELTRGHASGYSVSQHRDHWTWTAFYHGNVVRGSTSAKIDADWQARNAHDRLEQEARARA